MSDLPGFAAHPILAAVLLESTPPNAAWHGVVVLAAMLLWATRGRVAIALPAVAVVSLVAVTAAQAFGPHERWLRFVLPLLLGLFVLGMLAVVAGIAGGAG